MQIRWLTAFIDQPAASFAAGTRFWQAATQARRSSFRGEHDEFATLLPPSGDPYLRVQRTADGSRGVHLDLHVDSVTDSFGFVEDLGARLVHASGHLVLSSPAGMTFCLVPHRGESVITDPIDPERPHVLDQVCIDVPASRFDEEAGFWQTLTGWERVVGSSPEFEYLVRPPEMPIRLLLQRLGTDDPAERARAHLDLACGTHRESIAESHRILGATRVGAGQRWVTMRDPAGLRYCLTGRDPAAPRSG